MMTKEYQNELLARPPVVVIMGHVDHGKTTLLDYIRKTNIADKEAGGITQAIGAYEIEHNFKKITFIDTPGHEAFSKMRAHGAQVADLAILLIAADDGIMPQTKESIEILKKTNTPFIVAINKIDKQNANIEKVKQQLAENGVFLEGYGGNVSWQAISAKTGQGVNELLDLIILAAELEDLKYNPNDQATGVVISSQINPKKGNVVTVIVKNGKIKIGQTITTTSAIGKIKAIENFLGKKVTELAPSAPAVIYGFENLPQIGEEFFVNEKTFELSKAQIKKTDLENKTSINEIKEKTDNETNKEKIKLILNAEEQGSLEALKSLIKKLSLSLPLTIIDEGVGNIYENEVKLAVSANALIIGFKTKIDRAAENLAKNQNVNFIISDIIYDLEKQLLDYLKDKSNPIKGIVEVLAIFGEPKTTGKKKSQIIGGRISQGFVENKSFFEINRDDKKIGEGRILNLQSQKKDISRAETGQEIGLLIESETTVKIGDKIIFH